MTPEERKEVLRLERRKYIIGASAVRIIIIYLLRLLFLQLGCEDYKARADSNALMKQVKFPARGAITDRTGRLLVYNQPA